MNILPKKRWHVRTKENIARVRRDEAQAAEEEKERERRIKLAEKEMRREVMRTHARTKYGTHELNKEESDNEEERASVDTKSKLEHINLFADEEAGLVSGTAVNKEHEEEQKQEREKYEKQIGYLTYLGQDTNEATGNVSWYNKRPEREEPGLSSNEETGLKHKVMSDPLSSFKKFCASSFSKTKSLSSTSKTAVSQLPKTVSIKRKRERSCSPERSRDQKHKHKKKKKKHKKEKKRKSSHTSEAKYEEDSDHSLFTEENESIHSDNEGEKKIKLEKLRAERLRREKEEKQKAEKLMAKLNGVAFIDDDDKPKPKPVMNRRYNSQFNPDIAKQNYEDQRYRF